MTIYNAAMDISITEFKQRCLEIIRELEKSGRPVTITRHGRTVARLVAPSPASAGAALRPWERLQAMGGRLRAEPEESVLHDGDFEALRR